MGRGAFEVETFYGRDGVHWTAYLTRVALIGDLTLHVFHRGDADPDPHDHRRAFLTFPLTSYVEHVYEPKTGREYLRRVRAWRFHFRPAAYAHRVIGRWSGQTWSGIPLVREGGIVTLVLWVGRKRREWGFWRAATNVFGGPTRSWVPWRAYVYGEGRP